MHQQKGLSLIELMISITLGLILMTGVTQMFLSSKGTFTTQQGMSRVQETGRLAIDFLAQDVRMAGFTGFNVRNITYENFIPVTGIVNDYLEGISVYSAHVDVPNALPGTDILAIRGAINTTNLLISGGTELNLIKVLGGSVAANSCKNATSRLNGLCNDDVLIIADLEKAKIFAPIDILPNGADLDISFAGAWGGGLDGFLEGALVSKMRTVIYYVANGATGRPSLFQQVNEDPPLEILEGVLDMYITYCIQKTSSTFTDAADKIGPHWKKYIDKEKAPSAGVAAKKENAIVGVRIQLLVQSTEDNLLEAPQKYNFRGGPDKTAADRRMYQVFTTTVAVRNRLQ